MSRSLALRISITAAVATLATVVVSSPAGSATDTSPPVWVKTPTASIPLGAVLDTWDCEGVEYALGPVDVRYRARDPQSGIDHYEVALDGGNGPEDVGLVRRATMTARTTDPADCLGGPRPIFFAVAVDGAGLSTPEYSWRSSQLSVFQDSAARLTYKGSWRVSSCACWSGGTTHKSTTKGAAVRAKLLVPASDGTPDKAAVALVMAKGPDRGRAAIWLDGQKVATVKTHSATRLNRTVVWRAAVTPGHHVLRVVNLGSSDHPRIDVDALVLLPKGSRTFD